MTKSVGVFLRAGTADGRYEAYEFTDIDRTISAGTRIKGALWSRAHDEVGVALALDAASAERKTFLAAGGLGILVGDGQLRRPGDEHIAEVYYQLGLLKGIAATLDYQYVDTPAYNRERGPVNLIALRVHAQY